MPYPYFDADALNAKFGEQIVARVLDDGVGNIAADARTELIADACSRTKSRLRTKLTDEQLAAIETDTPQEVVRLALKAAHVELAIRAPEVMRLEWKDLESSWRKDLDDWATGNAAVDDVTVPQNATRAVIVSSSALRGW